MTVGDLRENVPLRAGSKKNSWMKSLSCSEEGLGGPKLITVSFGVLTAGITIALIAQIYYGDYQVCNVDRFKLLNSFWQILPSIP